MKKWSVEEEYKLVCLLKKEKTYLDISNELKRTKRSIKEKSNKLGYYSKNFKKQKTKINCLNCQKEINISQYNSYDLSRVFCSHSCSAIFNNKKRRKNKYCVCCDSELSNRQKKYCSSKCQLDFQYNIYIERWKSNEVKGSIINSGLSKHIRRYLFEKYDDKCSKCGWSIKNEYTGKIPLETEHIDGDSENNKEENLTLLCPNCHSLTKTYKGANKGNGRYNRRKRYKEGKSY